MTTIKFVNTLREKFQTRGASPFLHFATVFTLLAPSVLFRFQNHHDGYVLETSRFFSQAVDGEMDYPFSQYGPLWSTILGVSAHIFPEHFLLIGVRLVSVFAYALSMALAAKISILITKKSHPLMITLALVASWYFFGPYYGWPSTFILPFVLLTTMNFCKVVIGQANIKVLFLWIGFSIAMIQMARVQIGVLMFISVLALQLLYVSKKSILYTIIGYLASTGIFFIVLAGLGFLQDALYDQYYFGLKFHISSDRGASRIPIWTILVSFLTFVVLNYFVRNRESLATKLHLPIYAIITAIFLALILEFISESEVFTWLHWRLLQRVFVGFIAGVALFTFFRAAITIYGSPKTRNSINRELNICLIAVSLISLCTMSQIYPLFSSHHMWYSLIPILLSFHLLISQENLMSSPERPIVPGILIGALFIGYFGLWQQANFTSSKPAPISQLVLVEKSESIELSNLRKFADLYIPPNSVIQNFCPDPTIFVVRRDLVPASRIFIWWDKFQQFDKYRSAANQSADFALVCNESRLGVLDSVKTATWRLVSEESTTRRMQLFALEKEPSN